MDKSPPPSAPQERRPYLKPQLTRVDVFEDEVALVACKRTISAARSTSGVTSTGTCRTSCMTQAAT